jgi:TetR/AcrR family transcriptional repressor of nem operon
MNSSTDTRERILNSARGLIYTHSYAEIGVAQICADAEVTKGSFYHFFPSKRALTLVVLELSFDALKRELMDRAFAADLPPMQQLRRFVDSVIAFQSAMHRDTGAVPGCQFGNLAAEQATQDEVLRSKVAKLLARQRAALAGALQQAVGQGELVGIDVDATAAAMLAYLEGVLLMAKAQNDPGLLSQLLPTMVEIRIPITAAPAA